MQHRFVPLLTQRVTRCIRPSAQQLTTLLSLRAAPPSSVWSVLLQCRDCCPARCGAAPAYLRAFDLNGTGAGTRSRLDKTVGGKADATLARAGPRGSVPRCLASASDMPLAFGRGRSKASGAAGVRSWNSCQTCDPAQSHLCAADTSARQRIERTRVSIACAAVQRRWQVFIQAGLCAGLARQYASASRQCARFIHSFLRA